jgi:pimeloyl-ACP methyl ester carboxylesterase
MTTTPPQTGYAPVNGLNMYYEIHGTGQPLVLIHGGLSAIGSSFGQMLPALSADRQVIAVELQAHGHTADIDRPLSLEQMAEDTAALLQHLGIAQADFFGYSVGAAVALHLAVAHPEQVRKLVIAAGTYNKAGFHPGHFEGMAGLQPEMLVGTPWHDEYVSIAPRPDDWATLVNKIKHMDILNWSPETVQSIQAPTLIIIGDSDITRPEAAVELFRLLGGGVAGDMVGLPKSQLAILPGTSHTGIVQRGAWLVPMITEFLDAPMPEAK